MTSKQSSRRGVPAAWQEPVARLVAVTPLSHLLALAVKLIVPRHRVGVALVAVAEGRVLLLRHVFHPASPWGLPGGWLDRRESPRSGALRELREETGLDGDVGPLVYSHYEPRPPHIGLAFAARVEPRPLRLSREIIEADWFAPGELPERLMPFVRHAIAAGLDWAAQPADRDWEPSNIR